MLDEVRERRSEAIVAGAAPNKSGGRDVGARLHPAAEALVRLPFLVCLEDGGHVFVAVLAGGHGGGAKTTLKTKQERTFEFIIL